MKTQDIYENNPDRRTSVLPDVGSVAAPGRIDGRTPGQVYSSGLWTIIGGVLINIPVPSGFTLK